jgi:hypothetical protein
MACSRFSFVPTSLFRTQSPLPTVSTRDVETAKSPVVASRLVVYDPGQSYVAGSLLLDEASEAATTGAQRP